MKYATECKEVTIRNDELDKRSNSIREFHDSKIQPMKFFETRESSYLIDPIESLDESEN